MGNRKQQHNTTKSSKINKSTVSWPPAGTTIIYDNLISPIPCTSLYDQTGAADMFDGNVMSGSKHLWAASLKLVAADSPKLPMTSWLIGIVKSVPLLRCKHKAKSFDSQREKLLLKGRPFWCFCDFQCRFLGVLHGCTMDEGKLVALVAESAWKWGFEIVSLKVLVKPGAKQDGMECGAQWIWSDA